MKTRTKTTIEPEKQNLIFLIIKKKKNPNLSSITKRNEIKAISENEKYDACISKET